MEIREYPKVTDIQDTDLFLIDGDTGTRKISYKGMVDRLKFSDINYLDTDVATSTSNILVQTADGLRTITVGNLTDHLVTSILAEQAKPAPTAYMTYLEHRNNGRGKNLGTTVTEAQKAAIRNQTWDDIYVCDYWLINGIKYIIMDINYRQDITRPHLVLMPRTWLDVRSMVKTAGTHKDGYVGLEQFKNRADYDTILTNAFGDMVLEFMECLSNANNLDEVSGVSYYTVKHVAPTLFTIMGTAIVNSNSSGHISGIYESDIKCDMLQLSGFYIDPELIINYSRGVGSDEPDYYMTRDFCGGMKAYIGATNTTINCPAMHVIGGDLARRDFPSEYTSYNYPSIYIERQRLVYQLKFSQYGSDELCDAGYRPLFLIG